MKKITLLRNLTVGSLALLLVLAPLAVSAKDNDREDRSKKNTSCLRAYGHLIAPGWIKLNGNVNIEGRCWFPFGIGKKLGDRAEDKISPVISDITSEANLNNAVVRFNTNERADATVFYGTAAGINVDSSATLRVSENNLAKSHSLKLSGLAADTKYYFVIKSRDASGNAALSSELSFTTKKEPSASI